MAKLYLANYNEMDCLRMWSRYVGGNPSGGENELQLLKQIAIARGHSSTAGWNETRTLRAIAYTYGKNAAGLNDLQTLRSIVLALDVVPSGRTIGNLNELDCLRAIVRGHTSGALHSECTAISGATGLTFELPVGSAGKYYRYRRRATNSQGTTYSWSNAIGPITVPVILVSDTFTAANGTALSARTPSPTTAGFNWAVAQGDAGDCTIQSNKAALNDSVTPTGQVLIVDSGEADVNIACTFSADTFTGAVAGIAFRASDSNNYWQATLTPLIGAGEEFYLNKIVAGVQTAVDTAAVTLTDGADYTITVTLSGNSISATIGGVTVSGTDAAHNTNTKHGLISYNCVGSFDNFVVSQ